MAGKEAGRGRSWQRECHSGRFCFRDGLSTARKQKKASVDEAQSAGRVSLKQGWRSTKGELGMQ